MSVVRRVMEKFRLSEISAVDRPAQAHATMTIMKRADDSNDSAYQALCNRSFTAEQRRNAAASGAAMPDGSYPIENKGDTQNALHAILQGDTLMAVPTTTAINTAIETWRDTVIGVAAGAIAANTPAYNQVVRAVTDPVTGLEAMIDPLITDVSEAKATGVLTSSANYANNDPVVIGLLAGGSKTYTFQTTLTNVDGHVKIAATEILSLANLHHAINGTGGTAGTDYALATTAHPDVTATDDGAHVVTITANAAGSAWNAIATTTTSGTAAWGGATMTGGSGVDEQLTLAAVDTWRDSLRGPPLNADDASVAQLDTAVASLKTTLAALFT